MNGYSAGSLEYGKLALGGIVVFGIMPGMILLMDRITVGPDN